jgi:C-terminal processing protease CtpA/Prc
LALIKNMDDPNANIMAPNPIVTSFKGNNRAPLDVSFIEDKAVVTGLPAKPGTEKIKLREGDIILKINGKNIEDVVKEKSVYTAAANPSGLLRNIAIDLLRTNDSIIDLTYQREGIVDSAVVKCYQRDALFKLKNEQGKDSSFKYYPQGILYINANNFKSSTIEKIMPVIFKAKGLIIDLRNSPSEFFVNSLGDYLLPTPKPFAVYSKNNFYTPGLFTFADKKMIGSENHVYYRGRVVILVNEFTQSSAEYHAMAFRMAPKSMIIGSTTAGSIGPLVEVRLPGGIHTMVAGVGIYYPDGKEAQRLGIIPDALVVPTIKGVSAHRDEQLERALEILSK